MLDNVPNAVVERDENAVPRWLVDKKSKVQTVQSIVKQKASLSSLFVNVCFIFPLLFSSEGKHRLNNFLTFTALSRH